LDGPVNGLWLRAADAGKQCAPAAPIGRPRAAPRTIFTDDGRIYTFVPYVEGGELEGRKFATTAYLVALSGDGGESWKFVDGANLGPESIRLIIPSYGGQPLPPVPGSVMRGL
jgi:hypothetical protein